jgi:uncharacterized protein YgiM (DUF1202 family)
MKRRKPMVPILLSLLGLCLAVSLAHAYSTYYYIVPSRVTLRECAASNCGELLTVYQGERAEILERTSTGWSKIRLVDRAAIGWLRSDFLTYSPGTAPKAPPTYYVKSSSLGLRDEPNPDGNIVVTLRLNDPVEMLGVGASGWAQVRDLRTSTVGWVSPRYLSSSPVGYKKPPRRRRAPARKTPPKEEAPQEAPESPKAM